MNDPVQTCNDFVTATFSGDFAEHGLADGEVERIHRGEIGEWVHALARSGLFGNLVVAHAANAWRRNPRSLLDALLGDVDDVTAKRYAAAWGALDVAMLDETVWDGDSVAVNE